MTAVIGLVKPEAAYLAADAAVWAADGSVIGFRRKLVWLPASRTVFAIQGVYAGEGLALLTPVLAQLSLRDLHQALAEFSEFYMQDAGRKEWGSAAERMTITGASWHEGTPRLWIIDKRDAGSLEAQDVGAFRVCPAVDWSAALGRSVTTRADVLAMDPDQDVPRIMDAQREQTEPLNGEAVHLAGGWCDLAMVSALGCSIRTVKRWPDRVGQRIGATDRTDNPT